jgi:hypothetical protein
MLIEALPVVIYPTSIPDDRDRSGADQIRSDQMQRCLFSFVEASEEERKEGRKEGLLQHIKKSSQQSRAEQR